MKSSDQPLVSFVVPAYNQEPFIREAVQSALAQTWSPLEIVLSDDCSSDNTFAIMQETVARYHGPHRIILNRNSRNLGIGGHIDLIPQLTSGHFIIVAAGDDISLPQRTSSLMAHFLMSSETSFAYSDYEVISPDGARVGIGHLRPHYPFKESFIDSDSSILGAVCAWRRDCHTSFGPICKKVHNEDCLMPFRAALLGKLVHVPEILVRYREAQRGARFYWRGIGSRKWRSAVVLNYLMTERLLYRRLGVMEQKLEDLYTRTGSAKESSALKIRADRTRKRLAALRGGAWPMFLQFCTDSEFWRDRFWKLYLKRIFLYLLNLPLRSDQAN